MGRWHSTHEDGANRRAEELRIQRETAERLLCIASLSPSRRDRAAFRRVLLADPCAYCGSPSTQLDHIEPKSLGGSDDWTNRAGTCASCNGRKQDVPMLLWMGWRLTRQEHDPWDEARRALLTRS